MNDELRLTGRDGIQSATRWLDTSPGVIARGDGELEPTPQNCTNIAGHPLNYWFSGDALA